MPDPQISVLFVCLGNICRSPLAQGIFADLAARQWSETAFIADSAGTSGWYVGAPPDSRSIDTAARHGIDISGQRARRLDAADAARFAIVLAMDAENLAAIARLDAGMRCCRLLDFAGMPDAGDAGNVPDPYYGGASGFEDVFELLSRAMPGVIERLAASNGGR